MWKFGVAFKQWKHIGSLWAIYSAFKTEINAEVKKEYILHEVRNHLDYVRMISKEVSTKDYSEIYKRFSNEAESTDIEIVYPIKNQNYKF